MKRVIETSYPSGFRADQAKELGAHLANHHSVVLIGMKRVGISNFLRFFLSHNETGNALFVYVDLNDLIERNLSAFWTLLLTRLVDNVQRSTLPEAEKVNCRKLFVQSIQLKDHFFTLDSVRKVLEALVSGGLFPTFFLLRFDRLADVANPEFFSNLIGLSDAVKGKMSYVFTSFRPITELGPVFTKNMYLPPASSQDMKIILETLEAQHNASFDTKTRDALVELTGGYVQYLQLAVIRLHAEETNPASTAELVNLLLADEQIALQSEELFESLTKKEKGMLLEIRQGNSVTPRQRGEAQYLWNTGMVLDVDGKPNLFSTLFDEYVGSVSTHPASGKEFTKKEHALFTFLKDHEDVLCEREAIIDAVWAESKDLGISDWAIDRLVARLRSKLKAHASPYQVVTVVTRGYKLTKS